MRRLCEHRNLASLLVAALAASAVRLWLPFPQDDPLLALIRIENPPVYTALRAGYVVRSVTSPYLAASSVLSPIYIFFIRRDRRPEPGELPPYPDPSLRTELGLIVGELHHPTRPGPSEAPGWLTLLRRGLFTGLAVFGATGTGKTSCCKAPYRTRRSHPASHPSNFGRSSD